MKKVNRTQFYAYIGTRDIAVESQRDVQWFKTRNGTVVGKSNGYAQTEDVMEKYYYLSESAFKDLCEGPHTSAFACPAHSPLNREE